MFPITFLSGSGLNATLSTALVITETFSGLTEPRSTLFSFPVCDTQMEWLVFASENLRNVLVMMAEASLNTNREWSVNTDLRPSRVEIIRASWARLEKAE